MSKEDLQPANVPPQFIRPALLQERTGLAVRCLTCARRREILPGGLGWCRTRHNRNGRLEGGNCPDCGQAVLGVWNAPA